LRQALARSPGNPAFLDSRGLVHFRLGDYKAAIADYDAALKARPQSDTSLYARGIARKRAGDRGGARDVAAALALRPGVAKEFADMGITP
jgi:Flp pilus assembly protein TadD